MITFPNAPFFVVRSPLSEREAGKGVRRDKIIRRTGNGEQTTPLFLTQAVQRNDNNEVVTHRPNQRVAIAIPIALASIVCLSAVGDGSAGSVWLLSDPTKQAGSGASSESMSGWLTCLGRAACQIRMPVPMVVLFQPQSYVEKPVAQQLVRLSHTDISPIVSPILPQLINLPPPRA